MKIFLEKKENQDIRYGKTPPVISVSTKTFSAPIESGDSGPA